MRPPIFVPARGKAAPDHGARDIAGTRRCAEGSRAGAAGSASGQAAHDRAADEDMARPVPPLRITEQADQMIARSDRVGIWAGMPRTANAVQLARRHAR